MNDRNIKQTFVCSFLLDAFSSFFSLMLLFVFSVRLNSLLKKKKIISFLMKTCGCVWQRQRQQWRWRRRRELSTLMYRKYLNVNTKKSTYRKMFIGQTNGETKRPRKYYNHQRYVNIMRMAPTSRRKERKRTMNKQHQHF